MKDLYDNLVNLKNCPFCLSGIIFEEIDKLCIYERCNGCNSCFTLEFDPINKSIYYVKIFFEDNSYLISYDADAKTFSHQNDYGPYNNSRIEFEDYNSLVNFCNKLKDNLLLG
jgi:hypothetical protein